MEEPKGLFGKPKVADSKPVRIDHTNLGNLNRRMRILEERFINIQRKLQVTEENLLESNKEESRELKFLNGEVSESKNLFSELKEKLEIVIDELESKANQAEFLVYKKYVELWKPMSFVTEADVERVVQEALRKKEQE